MRGIWMSVTMRSAAWAASFVSAAFAARAANGCAPLPLPRLIPTASLLLGVHSLGLVALMWMLPVVTINHPRFEPRFARGTAYLCSRLSRDTRPGDLVVFWGSAGLAVDEVIAEPGDRVAVTGGKVLVNGLPHRDLASDASYEDRPETRVPEGSVAVCTHEARVWANTYARPQQDTIEILRRDAIAARVLAVYRPARRREWL